MEEGRNPISGDADASDLSHETIILPMGSGVLESARVQAAAPGQGDGSFSKAEESKWGARFQLALIAQGVALVEWMLFFVGIAIVQPNLSPTGGGVSSVLVANLVTTLFFALAFALLKHLGNAHTPFMRGGFYGSSLGAILCFVCLIVQFYSPTGFAGLITLQYCFLILFAGVVIVACVRIAHRIFGQLQSRLSEWLALLFAAGLLMAILVPLLGELPFSRDSQNFVLSFSMVLVVFLLVAGAAWAWSVAKQLGEEDGKRRLQLMLVGWLMVLGLVAGSSFLICLFAWMIEGRRVWRNGGMFSAIFILSFFGVFLILPGLSVHRRAKRAAAERAH